MEYEIEFTPQAGKDLLSLPKKVSETVFKKINLYLKNHPDGVGKPLQFKLKGCYEIKVSKYRVIYKVVRDRIVVLIVGIGQRKDDAIFKEMERRLRFR